MDFTWVATGFIQVATHVQALPSISLRTGSSSSSSKILVAGVLLVLLTAAQAGVVAYSLWLRMSEATTFWAILQVLSSQMQCIQAWLTRQQSVLYRLQCRHDAAPDWTFPGGLLLLQAASKYACLPDFVLSIHAICVSCLVAIQKTCRWMQSAVGETWVLYDLGLLVAMVICLITYAIYIQIMADFQPQHTYEVYDSLAAAQARLLLPKKADPTYWNSKSF